MPVVTSGPVDGAVRDRAVDFLETFGISKSIQAADQIYVAQIGSEVVGVVRLATESGVLVLRGMRVRADVQRRGVGSQLLDRLNDGIGDEACWCIPYGWLTGFYGRIGFRLAAVGDAPRFLAERHQGYIQNGMDVVVMVRASGELA